MSQILEGPAPTGSPGHDSAATSLHSGMPDDASDLDPNQYHETHTDSESNHDTECSRDEASINDPSTGAPALTIDSRDPPQLPTLNNMRLFERLEEEVEQRCQNAHGLTSPLITHGHCHHQYFRAHKYYFKARSRHYHINHTHHHHYHHHHNHYYYPSSHYNGFNGMGNWQILQHQVQPGSSHSQGFPITAGATAATDGRAIGSGHFGDMAATAEEASEGRIGDTRDTYEQTKSRSPLRTPPARFQRNTPTSPVFAGNTPFAPRIRRSNQFSENDLLIAGCDDEDTR